LSDDDLACLVDGKCTDEEKQQYFDHLASCTSCYDIWLHLFEAVRAETCSIKRAERFRFPGPKQLAWAGSFLAAAASIVLFINISRQVPAPMLHKPMKEQFEQENEQVPQVKDDIGGALPQPAVVPLDQEDKMDAFELEMRSIDAAPAVPVPVQENRAYKSTVPPLKAKKRIPVEMVPTAPPAADTVRMKAFGSASQQLVQWLDTIEQACVSANRDPRFWSVQYERGRALTGDAPDQGKQVAALLPLVAQLKQADNSQPVCRRILELVQSSHE
jgi:hypothetical protein